MFQWIVKYKLPVTIVLAICAFIVWNQNKSNHRVSEATKASEMAKVQSPKPAEKSKPALSQAKQEETNVHNQADNMDKQEPVEFNFDQAVSEVRNLVAGLPGTHDQVMGLILKKDVFKDKKIKVSPHSSLEITQNKMGAVKVMALRELMAHEQSNSQLHKDLTTIIKKAQDPTIARIAQAAQDSLKKGRSFFDDFLDGVSRLPMTDEKSNKD